MKVALEPFARASLEARFGADLSAATIAALRHYARGLRSKRRPLEVPDFRRGTGPDAGPLDLELPLSAEVESTLTAEAEQQGVSLARLTSHAVFVYLSDLDGPPPGAPDPVEERAALPRYRVNAVDTLSARPRAGAARFGCRLLSLAVAGAVVFAAAADSASASASTGAAGSIEGIWSFNGGRVGIQQEPNGTFTGTVVTPTRFARCTHETGEAMWTGITPQPDGSYWGLHQWFYDKESCPPNPNLGLTTWRVLEKDGYRLLRVCFSQPGSDEQPVIGADGAMSNFTYGCTDSALISPLPEPTFSSLASLPSNQGCLLRQQLRIRIRDLENDPLRKIRITGRSGGIRKQAKIKPSRHGYVGILNLKNLPEAPVTVTIRVTTTLGKHLSGKRTYARCLAKPAAARR